MGVGLRETHSSTKQPFARYSRPTQPSPIQEEQMGAMQTYEHLPCKGIMTYRSKIWLAPRAASRIKRPGLKAGRGCGPVLTINPDASS